MGEAKERNPVVWNLDGSVDGMAVKEDMVEEWQELWKIESTEWIGCRIEVEHTDWCPSVGLEEMQGRQDVANCEAAPVGECMFRVFM